MTSGSKFLVVLLLSAGLAGGAAYAGYAYAHKHEVAPMRADVMRCTQDREILARNLDILAARSMLVEAAMGLASNNGGFAFDRVGRAQMSAREAGLKLDKDFDELMPMLISQDPGTRQAILKLAEKIASLPATMAPPKGGGPAAKGGPALPPLPVQAAVAPVPASPPPSPVPAKAAEPEHHAAPPAAPPEVVPQRPGDRSLDEGYHALLDAKTDLLVGGPAAQAAMAKLARARVMLDESGHAELDDDLDAALAALRRHDDAKAREGLESALIRVRQAR